MSHVLAPFPQAVSVSHIFPWSPNQRPEDSRTVAFSRRSRLILKLRMGRAAVYGTGLAGAAGIEEVLPFSLPVLLLLGAVLVVLALHHHLHEPLHHVGALVRKEGAGGGVQGCNGGHVVLGEGKVEDIPVLNHPLPVGGLGQDDHTPLDVPTQHHLCRSLAVLCPDGVQDLILEETAPALAEGRPGLDLNPVLVHPLLGFGCWLYGWVSTWFTMGRIRAKEAMSTIRSG